jgi:hypothetical protein
MAAAGLSAALVERWQGFRDPGLLGPDPLEEQRREQLARLSVAEAFEPLNPLVLLAEVPAAEALALLIEAHGHCLIVEDGGAAVGLVTLADLQRGLSSTNAAEAGTIQLIDCRRTDLVWLPLSSHLDQLEDQLTPDGLRQIPIFDVPGHLAGYLPQGLPATGLPITSLRGMASRDGMARALAAKFRLQPSKRELTNASATGSA